MLNKPAEIKCTAQNLSLNGKAWLEYKLHTMHTLRDQTNKKTPSKRMFLYSSCGPDSAANKNNYKVYQQQQH